MWGNIRRTHGRLAQRWRTSLTWKGSLVRSQYRPRLAKVAETYLFGAKTLQGIPESWRYVLHLKFRTNS